MKSLTFQKAGQYFSIVLGRLENSPERQVVYYVDQKVKKFFGKPLRLFPPMDETELRLVVESAERKWCADLSHYEDLLRIRQDELEEFERCGNDQDLLRRAVLADATREGAVLVREEEQ